MSIKMRKVISLVTSLGKIYIKRPEYKKRRESVLLYTPYEGPILANQISRKVGLFARKLEVSHSPLLLNF